MTLRFAHLVALFLLASQTGSWAAGLPKPANDRADVARALIVIGYNGGTEQDSQTPGIASLAPERTPLSFADDDAARLYLQLAPTASRAWLLTTFDRESAKIFPELTEVARSPTRRDLAKALGEVFWHLRQEAAAGMETELVFAFAGHGDVDDGGEGYVVLADGRFSRRDLRTQVLEASPADLNHIIVDACSSYYFVKTRGPNAEAPSEQTGVPLTPELLNVLQKSNTGDLPADLQARTGLLVSTSSAAAVHESESLSAGVFSYLLRSALAGAGDTNADGAIEYGEVAAFIAAASRSIQDPRAKLNVHAEPPLQRPHARLRELNGNDDLRFLAVEAGSPTHLRVLDPRGIPYAEIHSSGEQPVYLALVGQPFFLVQKSEKEAVLVPRDAGAYALSSLQFSAIPRARSAPVLGTFNGLFAQPYGQEFGEGYWTSQKLVSPLAGPTFQPQWAVQGAPQKPFPFKWVGGAVGGTALTVGAAAALAVVGNQMAFASLETGFRQTGQLDPQLALEVEQWRIWASGLTLGAGILGAIGGGLWAWSLAQEREGMAP
jgi:hypothetical protein